MLLEDKICCYGTNQPYVPQSCIVAEGTIRVLDINKICYKYFYSSNLFWQHCPLLVYRICIDNYIDKNRYKFFSTTLCHRFLCHDCLEQDVDQICEYFKDKSVRVNLKGDDCTFKYYSLLCYNKRKTRTVQCSQLFADFSSQYQNMVHYDCFLGFLSLLTHECQNLFDWDPNCHFCIINILKIAGKITEYLHETLEGYSYSTYNNLFLYNYRVPSEINPFNISLSIEPIPRGVIEHHHLQIIPPQIIKREKAHN